MEHCRRVSGGCLSRLSGTNCCLARLPRPAAACTSPWGTWPVCGFHECMPRGRGHEDAVAAVDHRVVNVENVAPTQNTAARSGVKPTVTASLKLSEVPVLAATVRSLK